jgi:hypothetical protein
MRRLRYLQEWGGSPLRCSCSKHHIVLFSFMSFSSLRFSHEVFDEAMLTQTYVIFPIFTVGVFREISKT